MPLYQLVCIAAHIPDYQHIKGLVRQAATHVLGHAGVVRSIRSLGPMMLPQRMHRHKHAHSMGDYWQMDFDASPRSMLALRTMLRRDPRVVRWTLLKLAHTPTGLVAAGPQTIEPAAAIRAPRASDSPAHGLSAF